MKKLIVFLLLLILFPFVSYAQIWEGDSGDFISEGLDFGGGGSSGGSIDWDEFTGDKCTITFQTYDGSSPAQSAVVPVGVPSSYVMQNIDEPTKTGYVFGGWSLLDDYPTQVTIPDNFTATTTYYAILTKTRYTVYYNNPDNSLYTSQTYEYNDEIVEPAEPTYTNDYFWDWESLPDEMPAATFTVNAVVFPKSATVYGLEVDLDANASSTAYTYLYSAENMLPIQVDSSDNFNNFNDNATSWKSFIYQYVKPCMLKLDGTVDYYLDPDDQSLKADGITASDISNSSYDGNAMVEFSKLWSNAKRIKGTRKYRLIISPSEIPNITFAEAFKREDGTYADKVYYSMFNASFVSGGTRAMSLSGVGNIDSSGYYLTLENRAKANGAGWDFVYEALTQHIYKILFMVGKTIEPQGILFNKSNVSVNRYGAPDHRSYGVENGCFHVDSTHTLIKLLWLVDLFGSRAIIQTGAIYLNKNFMLKYPPFPDFKSTDGYQTIFSYDNDNVYKNGGNAIYYTRLNFYKGIAYESKFSTSPVSSAVFDDNNVSAPCWFGIDSSHRNNQNQIMYSNRNIPYRIDFSSWKPNSVSYHHCGYNGSESIPNSSIWGYRISYVPPSASTLLNFSPSAIRNKVLLDNTDKMKIRQIATPSSDLGGNEK